MRACAVPDVGDIVVRQADRLGVSVYALSRTPGPDQVYLPTQEEAVARAITFAKLTGVRAWFASGVADCVLLAVHAPQTPERGVQYGAASVPETA